MKALISALLGATMLAVALTPTASAAAVSQGAYGSATWITGPFDFDGHTGAYQQLYLFLNQERIRGSEGAFDRRCYYYVDTIYLPDPSGAGGEPLRQTASSGCIPDPQFSASLDVVTLPTVTISTHTWAWTDGVPSQPIPGTLTLAFELTALGPWAEPLHMESCYDMTYPCANTVTRLRPASAELWIDGMSAGLPTYAGIVWGIAIWPCLISDPSTCEPPS